MFCHCRKVGVVAAKAPQEHLPLQRKEKNSAVRSLQMCKSHQSQWKISKNYQAPDLTI